MKTLSAAQQTGLEKLSAEWKCAYELQVGLVTLRALVAKGYAESRHDLGSFSSPLCRDQMEKEGQMSTEPMTPESLVALLNGREYGSEISIDEQEQAAQAGLVVVFGYSDDNVEFQGAIDDEVSAYNGTTVYLASDGLLQNDCDDERCPYFKTLKKTAVTIEALWCKEGEYSWTYKTDIPHATFDIVEDGEPYCRGIVFRLADVQSKTGASR